MKTEDVLRVGDVLPSSGNGYALVIPLRKDPTFQAFYDEATEAMATTEEKRVKQLTDFVEREIVAEDVDNGKQFVDLLDSVKQRKGICKERSALLHLLLQEYGIHSEYKRGLVTLEGERVKHAWVKVYLNDGRVMLADPNLPIGLQDYDEMLSRGFYQEGKNPILRA